MSYSLIADYCYDIEVALKNIETNGGFMDYVAPEDASEIEKELVHYGSSELYVQQIEKSIDVNCNSEDTLMFMCLCHILKVSTPLLFNCDDTDAFEKILSCCPNCCDCKRKIIYQVDIFCLSNKCIMCSSCDSGNMCEI